MRRDKTRLSGMRFDACTSSPAAPGSSTRSRTRLMMGTGLLGLCLAVTGLSLLPSSAQAQQAGAALPASSAAVSARQVLDGPRVAPPVVTDNAGIGTGTALPPTRAALPQRAPQAETEAPAQAVGAPTLSTEKAASPAPAAPVQPAQNTAQQPNPALAQEVAPASAAVGPAVDTTAQPAPVQAEAPVMPVSRPVRGGTDSAGDAGPAPAATASAPVAPTPVAPAPVTTATTQAPAPAPAPAATPQTAVPAQATVAATPAQQSPIADALATALLTPETLSATSDERDALFVFYAARGYQPVFVDETGVNSRGAAILSRLRAAEEDGLNPADYAANKPEAGADAAALARAELDLAVSALTYARHAQSGRFNPTRISALVTPTREIPKPEGVLATLASVTDANAALAAYNPPHPGYLRLKTALAASATPASERQVTIPAGPLLKPGSQDPRVPALRARLGLNSADRDDLAYDPDLADAVKTFQDSMQIKPTGMVGDATVRALNRRTTPGAAARADIIANMERWRWLPRDLGQNHVMVNIPEYMLRIYSDDKPIHSTRVVVGKAASPTAVISKPITYVVINPAWNIPPSIVRNEMMPMLQNNPGALAKRGIEVTRTRSGGYSFRQMPGPKNALGRVKFMFPNDHAIYLHDTPSKGLFANSSRAYSHGCVRVQQPFDFGSVLFNLAMNDQNWTEERFTKMFGNKERYINLKRPVPVHLVYFTTAADERGRITAYEDIYGFNAAVKARLGLDSRHHMADGATTRQR